jgi:biopolymer transport protein ExbD
MRRRQGSFKRLRFGTPSSGSVNLISMMDVLTVLLLFLLKSYVAGGEIMVPPTGVRLPASSADAPPEASLVIAIDEDEILVGNEPVASLAEALVARGLEIQPLSQRLQLVRQQQEEIARLRGAEPTEPTVTIQGDRDVEFRALQKVMFTLNQNGYQNIALAVIQKS